MIVKLERKNIDFKLEVVDIERNTLEALITIIQNSTREQLNNYLESIGGAPDIISVETGRELIQFSGQLHNQLKRI